jgi:hypothetical protein
MHENTYFCVWELWWIATSSVREWRLSVLRFKQNVGLLPDEAMFARRWFHRCCVCTTAFQVPNHVVQNLTWSMFRYWESSDWSCTRMQSCPEALNEFIPDHLVLLRKVTPKLLKNMFRVLRTYFRVYKNTCIQEHMHPKYHMMMIVIVMIMIMMM